MVSLVAGYPRSNPILAGMAGILRGGDPGAALAARDLEVTRAAAFCAHAIEATGWLSEPGDFGALLVAQAGRAFSRCTAQDRVALLALAAQARGTSKLAADMARDWEERMTQEDSP